MKHLAIRRHHITREAPVLQYKKTKTEYYDTETITYLEPKIWDFLPNEIKSSVSDESTCTSKLKF